LKPIEYQPTSKLTQLRLYVTIARRTPTTKLVLDLEVSEQSYIQKKATQAAMHRVYRNRIFLNFTKSVFSSTQSNRPDNVLLSADFCVFERMSSSLIGTGELAAIPYAMVS